MRRRRSALQLLPLWLALVLGTGVAGSGGAGASGIEGLSSVVFAAIGRSLVGLAAPSRDFRDFTYLFVAVLAIAMPAMEARPLMTGRLCVGGVGTLNFSVDTARSFCVGVDDLEPPDCEGIGSSLILLCRSWGVVAPEATGDFLDGLCIFKIEASSSRRHHLVGVHLVLG